MNNNDTQARLRKEMLDIANEVFDKRSKELEFSSFEIPKHTHNGKDSPRINQVDIEPGYGASGSMTFATSGRRYKIKLPSAPTHVYFYGVTTNGEGGNRILNIGTAFLGKSFYLQPDDVETVIPGPYFNVTQCCTSANILGLTGVRVHDGHLVRSQSDSKTIVAELTIPSLAYPTFGKEGQNDNRGYLNGYLYLDCYLASEYSIVGNIICTS